MVRFINRERELEVLEKEWNGENAFVVVYGRRRIGKSKLIEEFLKDKKGIMYIASDTNKAIQIREFKNIVAGYLKDSFLAKQEISDWGSLFDYLAKVLSKEQKFYVWIDEFSYVVKNDSSITSILQKFIDFFIRSSRIFFIVSGSLFGLMSEEVLSSSSPLYGRRTRDLLLHQLHLKHASEFFKMGFEDILKINLTIGGIPEYLIIASRSKDYKDFIENEFLKKEGYFYREPYFLLSQEFKEIKTYLSILNAIAYGNTKPSEIANFVGINAREIYPYLELLISYGFVKRETSVLGDKKRGIYLISDNFFDFWFNFAHKNRERIEIDGYRAEKGELNEFLGKRFGIFIKENFRLFLNYPLFGRWWHKDKEIDVIALNEQTKEILFAECKWQDKVNAEKIVAELREKAGYVGWNKENRKESYAVFAKSFSKKITKFEGKKAYCFDLRDIEKVLRR